MAERRSPLDLPRDPDEDAVDRPPFRGLHWGCGHVIAPGWINSDVASEPGVDIACDIRAGLPLPDDDVDAIVSHHGLQDLKILEQVPAMRELRRVLKPGGVLRLSLPDLDRAIAAYLEGRTDYFHVHDWATMSGNFITHILWYNFTATLFTWPFAEELLRQAGFREVRRVEPGVTTSRHPAIVDLDSREGESFFVEAFK